MPLLNVPIHLQDDWNDCGPACAQMVLRSLQGPAFLYQQSAFVTGVPGHKDWSTTPDQLLAYITDKLSATDPHFSLLKFPSKQRANAMTRLLSGVTAIPPAKSCPGVALVYGGDHWVVVFGVTGRGASRMIHVRNPTPDRTWLALLDQPLGGPPLPPHVEGDACQEDDAHGVANNQVPPDEVLTTAEWQDTFTTCTYEPASLKHKYIVIAPQTTAMLVKAVPKDPITEDAEEEHPPAATSHFEMGSVPLLPPAAVGTSAWEGLRASGLLSVPGWDTVQPPPPSLPPAVLVERLDGGSPYYLTAQGSARGGALVGIDAVSGAFRFARLNPSPVITRGLFTTAREILSSMPTPHGPASPGPSARLVWKGCRETFRSHYFPLVEITYSGQPPYYIRPADRRRFDILT